MSTSVHMSICQPQILPRGYGTRGHATKLDSDILMLLGTVSLENLAAQIVSIMPDLVSFNAFSYMQT